MFKLYIFLSILTVRSPPNETVGRDGKRGEKIMGEREQREKGVRVIVLEYYNILHVLLPAFWIAHVFNLCMTYIQNLFHCLKKNCCLIYSKGPVIIKTYME